MIICILANSKVLISNMAIVFSQTQLFFGLHETLHFDKLEGADFKYDNSFLKFQLKKYPNKTLLVLYLSFFFFNMKLFILANSKVLVSNMTQFFSNPSPKIPKQDIFCSKFIFLNFNKKLCSLTNMKLLISNMTIFFSNFSPKIERC